jgi:hypothetical protein
MDKKELQQHYFELQRQFEANKTKRAVKTILAFAVAFFWIGYVREKPTGIEILYSALASIVIAGFHFFINAFISGQLCDVSNGENRILEGIKKKLDE